MVVKEQNKLHYLSANMEGNDHYLNSINSHSEFKLQNKLADPISLGSFSWSKLRNSNYLFAGGGSLNKSWGEQVLFSLWGRGCPQVGPRGNFSAYSGHLHPLLSPIQKSTLAGVPPTSKVAHPCQLWFFTLTPLLGTLEKCRPVKKIIASA